MSIRYSEEFKLSVIAKLLPPHNVSVPDLVKETGVSKDPLYAWRIQYRKAQGGTGVNHNQQPGNFNNEQKLAIIIETASLSEVELGEYCRRKGVSRADRRLGGRLSAWAICSHKQGRARTTQGTDNHSSNSLRKS